MSMGGSKCIRPLLMVGIITLLSCIFYFNPRFESQIADNPDESRANVFESRRLQSTANHGSKVEDKVILTPERSCLDESLGGYLFKETGRSYFVNADITSCLIHSFSPYVEREAAKRFLDPPHDQLYLANSPAVTWYNGELVLVARIWLDREKYEPKNDWPPNHFADNYLYTQKFDHYMKPTNNGSIIGIPAPKQWWVGDGPIEPRVVTVQNRLLISFNAAMAFKQKVYMDYTVLWDYNQNMPIIPKIKGGTPMVNATEKDDMPRDKHWMALTHNDELYFVHNLDPLRVMKCSVTGYCEFVYNDETAHGFIFEHHISHLRGGTPFELYEYPYYVSVAHSTMYKTSNHHRYYTAHMVVLCMEPYRIVYVSDHIKIHQDIYRSAPMVRPRWIDDGFIFPVGIILETKDWLTIGVHVNDFSSVLIRMKGIKKLMDTVIKLDRKQNVKKGPPVGYLHKHIHDTQQNLTHVQFVHR